MRLTIEIAFSTFALTLGMFVAAAILAVRRVLAADPAEVF
jgi:hypothetical protein